MAFTQLTVSLLCLAFLGPPHVSASAESSVDPDMTWWARPRTGANCQNETVESEYWRAAEAAGIEFVRLVPDGWPAEQRDFLMGDADRFVALVPADLEVLRRVLDDAEAAGVGVVLTFFSLPGARWRQLNGDVDDYRLWNEPESREQALAFWTQLAIALNGHAAIVAYNPLNEPHPEREHGITEAGFLRWSAEIEGTFADVNRFNREVVAAIREGDPTTPIVLDGGFYASPFGLTRMMPVDDPATLFAFHYYDPWDYVTYRVNEGRFSYPVTMPEGWTPAVRRESLSAVAAWSGQHRIDHRRIIASEFGCDRRVEGATAYLDDLLTDLARWDWHWAFYAFRGDGAWGGLDYELGTAPLDGPYWVAVEEGADPETMKQRGPNPLWEVIEGRLRGIDPCTGAALDLSAIRAEDRCGIDPQLVGDFPGPDALVAEVPPLSLANGAEATFPVVYRNVTDQILTVDLYLGLGMPAITPSRVLLDGAPVEPPPSCTVSELTLAEGRRVTLLSGGSLKVEARFVARPGGEFLWTGAADSCDVALPPGEYSLELPAPQRTPSRVDSVRLTVEQ